jgi:hypothetical protein
VQFPLAASSVVEQATTIEVEITLSEPTHSDMSVPYTTGGTATYDTDWRIEEPNPILIPAGDVSITMTLVLANDPTQEVPQLNLPDS